MGQHHSAYALGLLLALTGAAGAQEPEKMPLGWFLEEFESAGLTDIYLYWLDPAAGGPLLQVSCQEKWPDVVVSAYMDAPANAPKSVELVDGDTWISSAAALWTGVIQPGASPSSRRR